MRRTPYAIALLLAVAANLACSSTPARNAGGAKTSQAPPQDSTAAAFAQSVNSFACDLYRELKGTHGNLTFSPLSVSAATGLTYAGASGTTREEMQRVLHLPAEDAQAYNGYRSLFAHLDEHARAGGARWTLANRMWVQEGMPLQPVYLKTTRKSFGSDAGTLDFARAPEPARTTMNQWVEQKTENRIRDLFPAGSITPLTRLVLANAVYFKGRWAEAFRKDQTRSEPFHVSRRDSTPADMMYLTHHFRLAAIAGARVLELPYLGEQLSMLIVLPDAVDGLASLEGRLSADSLLKWTAFHEDGEVSVGLPRFTTTSQFSLSQTLATLGMPSAFVAEKADFSGMDGTRDLFISLVEHKAFVEVNEEGTEAAAATGVTKETTATTAMPEEFIANRPFLFLIRDRASGAILFMGRVTDPTR